MTGYMLGRINYGNFGMGRNLITKLLSRQSISMCKSLFKLKGIYQNRG